MMLEKNINLYYLNLSLFLDKALVDCLMTVLLMAAIVVDLLAGIGLLVVDDLLLVAGLVAVADSLLVAGSLRLFEM